MAFDLVEHFDAFQDNPWPIIYKELDEKYPNSKFILTVRDSESWLVSQVKHFGRKKTPMRKWIYGVGCPKGNETIYIERFKNHNKEVLEYFKNRPEDLLTMDLAKEGGWEKLCIFLVKNIQTTTFPHENKASDRENEGNIKKAFRKLNNLVRL
jgi:lysyl-tRNA synthetase class I